MKKRLKIKYLVYLLLKVCKQVYIEMLLVLVTPKDVISLSSQDHYRF